jgi:hypothetical protein
MTIGPSFVPDVTEADSAESIAHVAFLRSIEHAVFPLTILKPEEVSFTGALRAKKWVLLQNAGSQSRPEDTADHPSIVIKDITEEGRAELRRRQTLGPWEWQKKSRA